ncbi:hypothetical protein HDU79_011286 [Rhizoclosmatium sp. JEL0117]|nr:hypothetical protein HDU79_011286 [Rhizoclosmatium sp. JEL0117]
MPLSCLPLVSRLPIALFRHHLRAAFHRLTFMNPLVQVPPENHTHTPILISVLSFKTTDVPIVLVLIQSYMFVCCAILTRILFVIVFMRPNRSLCVAYSGIEVGARIVRVQKSIFVSSVTRLIMARIIVTL